MPLIEQEIIAPKKEQVTVRLNPELMELLECYARFIHSGQNYVVEQSLRYTFSKDRDFQQWLPKNRTTGAKENDRNTAAMLAGNAGATSRGRPRGRRGAADRGSTDAPSRSPQCRPRAAD